MLELRNIKKDYPTGGETVNALKGIDLQFRKSEFVSILGQSGCGKTTMLNIIGGLDQYTSGDLIINGKSTKNFKDRDWDSYRNHSIGFVFQTYNLIPHQSVLQNVELALTLSGVSKSERRSRAKKALEEVGLASQMRKKPSEMSGGQMQRVAIARAIVNNPDIILADEPTGALDSETSLQVMDILKEISKNRLVIMVTHNPELAEKYSTRIIRMMDGRITDDSMPLSKEEAEQELLYDKQRTESEKNVKKPSMSFATSFSLSLKNLFTKKGRTLLTSFAGSIGIIGISLIFAVSHGTTSYINAVQEDTLSSYPLTLEAQTMDLGSLLTAFMGNAQSGNAHENDAVYQKSMLYDFINALNSAETIENDLHSFKKFLEAERANPNSTSGLYDTVTGVQYTYDMDLLIYTENVDGTIIRSDTQALMQQILAESFGMDFSSIITMQQNNGMSGSLMMSGSSSLWQEMLPGDNGKLINPILEKQYDVIYGSWPTEYNEIVLVVDSKNELDDMTLYALGLKTKEEIDKLVNASIDQTIIEFEEHKWSYEEICGRTYVAILNSDCYKLDETTGLYVDLRESTTGLKYLYDNGIPLKVSGIIRPNKDAASSMLRGSIGYTGKLTEYIINHTGESDVIKAQLENPDIDIFTGLPFKDTSGSVSVQTKAENFRSYINSLSNDGKAAAYIKIMSIPDDKDVNDYVSKMSAMMTRDDIEKNMITAFTQQTGMSSKDIENYLASMSDEELFAMFAQLAAEQYKAQYAAQTASRLGLMEKSQLVAALNMAMSSFTDEQCAKYHDEVLVFASTTYETNLRTLGYVDLDDPSTINLYSASFKDKDTIKDAITKYNEGADEFSKINYTDYVGIMMSSITSIINAITYVLISFVAVSLIVSSIMIGVITLISVQERTKEIGILRAIGASKKNVSSMFNAETLIIGFTSGLLGVLITYLLCIPINFIMHKLTKIDTLSAILPIQVAVTLIIISMLLTLIAGVIPSRSAAKKDPVVALRTE